MSKVFLEVLQINYCTLAHCHTSVYLCQCVHYRSKSRYALKTKPCTLLTAQPQEPVSPGAVVQSENRSTFSSAVCCGLDLLICWQIV